MSDKTLTDLREVLFQTLASLRDKANPMDIERARAVGDIAKVIINSAKVEVDYVRATDAVYTSPFLGGARTSPALPSPDSTPNAGAVGRTVHRIR